MIILILLWLTRARVRNACVYQYVNKMAAASFGIMEKEGLIVGEVSGKALELDSEETVTFKNGHTPQEGTKEHMNVVEVSRYTNVFWINVMPAKLSCLASPR